MKRIKIERLTEKDLFIPYEKIVGVTGGPSTILIDYKTVDDMGWHVWLANETTMSWTRIDDDGSQVKNTLVTAEDFNAFVEFLTAVVKQNESDKAIESL
jgi:hypothetical protein